MKTNKTDIEDSDFYLDCLLVTTPLDGGQRVANHLDGDVPLVAHSQALNLLLLVILKPWSLCTKRTQQY